MTAIADRPVIHIGYHRTATTWFQEQFYPRVRNGTFVPRMAVRDLVIAPDAFSFSPEVARAGLLQLGGGRRLLVCEENLSGYLHNGGLGGLLSKEVANRVHASFPDARIVVFIRSQPRIVAAAYAQYVKGGGTHSASRYVLAQREVRGAAQHWYKAPLFALDHFEYGPLLAHYASLFGRDSVVVRLYEQLAEDPRRFLEAFATELDLEVAIEEISLNRVNPSLSRRHLKFLRRLNLLTARSVIDKRSFRDLEGWYERRWEWVRRFDRMFGGSTPDKPVLSAKLMRKIEDRFRDSNAALARDWGLPLDRYGYPLPGR
jgi:hypothetical protein